MTKKYENKFGERMIKQLLNSVFAKYGDLSVSRRSQLFCSPLANPTILREPSFAWLLPELHSITRPGYYYITSKCFRPWFRIVGLKQWSQNTKKTCLICCQSVSKSSCNHIRLKIRDILPISVRDLISKEIASVKYPTDTGAITGS